MDNIASLSYKDLLVWQKSLEFANKVIDITENLQTTRSHFRLIEQIEASATSVPMNIAEGKGRISPKEYKHFLIIARGSLYETMTLVEIFKLRKWVSEDDYNLLISEAIQITKMLNSLNKKISTD
ncbi:MAG: four helix bundle protein [Anaerolineaceae bacterium]